jgi:type IV secretion system protein VirD4
MGNVIRLSPTDLDNSHRFNPMDTIRSDNTVDDARELARLLVRPDATDPHWDHKAMSLVTALILHALADPDPTLRTLSRVRTLSLGGKHLMHDRLEEIASTSPSGYAREIAAGFLGTMGGDNDKAGEFESILSTVHKATERWSADSPAGVISGCSTFSLEELVGDQASTLYLCVSEAHLKNYDLWLRVMTGCILAACTRARRNGCPRYKTLLLLDEMAVLGRLDVLEENSGLLRAYCTPVLIWQNIPQVERVYGASAPTFLANASCKVFFGVQDDTTARHASVMCGQTTTRAHSNGMSQAPDAVLRASHSQGEADSGYWLIDPSEVQRLVHHAVIKMIHVVYPLHVRRLDYRKVRRWKGRWDYWGAPSPVPAPDVARPPAPAAAAETTAQPDASDPTPYPAADAALPPETERLAA